MAYSAKAVALRRCVGTSKAGRPCRAWAVWDDPRQLCVQHAGRGHTGPMQNHRRWQPARYVPCTCAAYAFPHRPSAGICRWPDPPLLRLTTPAGTKSRDGWPWPTGQVVRVAAPETRDDPPPEAREPGPTLEEELSRYGNLAPLLLEIERRVEARWGDR